MSHDITIVIVTYSSSPILDDCLRSLFADEASRRCQVLVVDNASSDADASAAITARYPDARFVHAGGNDGFGAGNNVGIALSDAPLVLIANPDTRLESGGLEGLVDFMRAHPRAGLAGPLLLNADRTLQHSIRRYPSVGREFVEGLLLHRALPRLTRRLTHVEHSAEEYARSRRVEWVSGAVMLARTQALRQVGGFDEGFFLYSEEIDLCRRLERAGWEIWFTPDVSFVHIGGENDESPLLGLETQRSKLRYFLKHEGRARMLLVAAATVARLTLRAAGWLLPAALSRQETRRLRLRAALHVLARYPSLLAEFLFTRSPSTVSRLTGASR